MTLAEYLSCAAGEPFARGKSDCCMLAARWVQLRRGVDPAEGLGDYDNDFGAARVIQRAGGFARMICAAMERCGLATVEEAVTGDIGLIRTGLRFFSMGIKTETGWACKEQSGLVIARFDPIVVWRV